MLWNTYVSQNNSTLVFLAPGMYKTRYSTFYQPRFSSPIYLARPLDPSIICKWRGRGWNKLSTILLWSKNTLKHKYVQTETDSDIDIKPAFSSPIASRSYLEVGVPDPESIHWNPPNYLWMVRKGIKKLSTALWWSRNS